MMKIFFAALTACSATAAIAVADNLPTPTSGTCKILFCQIVLDPHVMPQGGVLGSAADSGVGVLGSAADRWAVHGVIEGVSYRYGAGTLLYVANRRDQDWQEVNFDNAWLVSCSVKNMMDAPSCWVARDASLNQGSAGFEISDGNVCFPNYPRFSRADIAIDSAAPILLPEPDFCLKDAAAAALLQTIRAGQVVHLRGFSSDDDTPIVDVQLQTTGLQQALTLRDWILAQYAAGKLKLAS